MFQEIGEPILRADLVAPGERVAEEEYAELLTVLYFDRLPVSVPDRVGVIADSVIRLGEVRIARPPEYRMLLHRLKIPGTIRIDRFRRKKPLDALVEYQDEDQTKRERDDSFPHGVG